MVSLAIRDWAAPLSSAGQEEAGPQKARLRPGNSARLVSEREQKS